MVRISRIARLLLPVLVLGSTVLLGGCYARVYGRPAAVATVSTSGYVVYEPPPPRRVVVRPAAPYQGAIWVDGHWQWNGAQYVWVDGYWEQPRVGYVYVQPRWVRRGRGWVYVQGAWQPGGAAVHVHQPATHVHVRPRHHHRGDVRVVGPRVRGRARVQVR